MSIAVTKGWKNICGNGVSKAINGFFINYRMVEIDLSFKIPGARHLVFHGSKKNVLIQTIVVLCIFLVVGIGGYIWRSNNIASQTDSAQTTLSGQLTDFVK